MDLQMPEVDGFKATEQIRQLEKSSGSKRVPIVALTASLLEETWNKCQETGIDGYLKKPFRSEELIGQLIRVIS